MRSWVLWISFLLFVGTAGWFWLLSRDLKFTRLDQAENKPVAEQKSDGKKKDKEKD